MRTLFWLLCLALIFALALPGCTTPGSATPQGDGTMTVTVSAARVANCKAHGGCGLYSRDELLQMIKEAAEAGTRQTCPAANKVLL